MSIPIATTARYILVEQVFREQVMLQQTKRQLTCEHALEVHFSLTFGVEVDLSFQCLVAVCVQYKNS